MPAHSLLNIFLRRKFGCLFLLLPIAATPLRAAEKWLPGHVPEAVARGNLAPLGRVPGTNQLRLALGLRLRDAAGLSNLLAAIYSPGRPEFHHYLTPQEFAERFGPTPADYAAVIAFAATNGLTVTATHPSRLLVDVAGKAADVERALHVRLNSFRHPTQSRNFFAPDREPTVDARLPLFHVSGLDNFSRPHPHLEPSSANVSPHAGSGPNAAFIGNDFRLAYVPGTPLTGAGQNVGLVEYDGFFDSDITNYANMIGLTNNLPQRVTVPVDGGVILPGDGAVEVALDIEMLLAMSPGVASIYVYEAPGDAPWADLLSRMADDNLARQLSSSWSGGAEDPASEQIFQQMAAQGQSFFNATGDSAALAGVIDFPCDSPNITQVGGTYLGTDASGNYAGESAWNRGGGVGSSGGISPLVPIPIWQLGTDMTTNHGSTTQRNVPDVALVADGVYIVCFGQGAAQGGTSCSAPLWAGLTALVNQQAAQLGQPPVGFLNPAIYALGRGANYPATFHDITAGNNTNAYSPNNFYAVPGFDLCTGWGTPNGTNFINALTTPDFLGVLPPTVFSANGLVGGPFSQTNWTVTLTNSGAANLFWALGGAPSWLNVSANNGTLGAHGAVSLNLQLVNPKALPGGSYLAVLPVTNQVLSRVQTVAVRLNIGQSIVQNGGFETGDFTGWTLVGDTVVSNVLYNVVATDVDFPGLAHSGTFGARLHERGFSATLSQTLATTPGQRYLVTWWLENPLSSRTQKFKANWNGTNFVSLTNPAAFGWVSFQFVGVAAGTNAVLQFAAENDTNYFGLDDVSVTMVPPVAFANYLAGANAFQLAWNSLGGLNYQVQYKTNLTQASWLNLGTVTAATNVTAFADTNLTHGLRRFYRLELLP
jgi:hypothetical protein